MTQIVLGENDRLDKALKSFRRMVQRSGLLKELRDKRFYLKPSAARKLKIAAARRRKRTAARKARLRD
ncbi:MAG TPA: 30S ribosomal protein S21 [Gemmatimonadales bacterium]|nr:30S ribosomal protein S21 [Gemmatimonadales bacterium]